MTTVEKTNLLEQLDYSVLQQCMHCGMCLPTCPTYDETHRERNSPRGRIALMRDVADGRLPISDTFAEEMYYCLGCLACQTACPAGVNYAELFETARAEVERQQVLSSPARQFYRWLALRCLFMRPKLLHFVGRLLWGFQRSGLQTLARKTGLFRLLPRSLRRLEPQTPKVNLPFSQDRIAERETPPNPRFRVGLLTGCVQDLIYADVNRDTANVLLHNGCEVITPRYQPCCGSLHAHNGDLEGSLELAKRNIDAFDIDSLDAVISNSGGCGSHLKHYSKLLAGVEGYEARAQMWDLKVKDIHEWLVEIDYQAPHSESDAKETIVTYDQSCHLCHGQKIFDQPQQILQAIPGIKLVDLPESDWCCGSAGIYSITQPAQAEKLLNRKLVHLESTGATVLATANPGCLLQLSNGIQSSDTLKNVNVLHPISLLADAYVRENQSKRVCGKVFFAS